MYSIIVPTYNRCELLPICINHIIEQDFNANEFEILIIDNNSKDSTPQIAQEIIKRYPHHIVKYFKETKQGLVYSRHKGAIEAQGDILIFTDDDAFWTNKESLKVIKKSFELYPGIEGVSGKIEIQWDSLPDQWIYPYECFLGKLDLGPTPFIMKNVEMNGAHFVIKKSTLFRFNGFNPDQIFDQLIGDGESGLCRKLTEQRVPILWQPNSSVQHFQLKSKNATFADINRRFANNGAAKAYEFIIENQYGKQVISGLKSSFEIGTNIFKIMIKKMIGKSYFTNQFQISLHKAIVTYYFKFYLNKSFRTKVLNDDWKLVQTGLASSQIR